MTDTLLSQTLVRHSDRVFGFLLALGAAPDEADDIFQEVAVAAAGSDVRPDEPVSWLISVARRRLADRIRANVARRGRETAWDDELADSVADAMAEAPDDDDQPTLNRLLRCLDRLAPRARQLIDLRYRDQLSPPAIAIQVSWSEPAVRTALSKARRALELCMGTTTKDRV